MQNRRLSLVLSAIGLLWAGTATAQTLPSAGQTSPAPAPNTERAVERLRIQDAGSRIDELRVGGETQSITVQPAGNAPAYEVRPATSTTQDGAGSRFWNVLKF